MLQTTPDTELELIWSQFTPRTLMSDVIKAVAIYTGVPTGSLLSRRRTKKLVVTRWAAFYLCRNLSTASFPQIGRAFNKDHTTVLYGCGEMDKLVQRDLEVKAHMAAIQALAEKIRDERTDKLRRAA